MLYFPWYICSLRSYASCETSCGTHHRCCQRELGHCSLQYIEPLQCVMPEIEDTSETWLHHEACMASSSTLRSNAAPAATAEGVDELHWCA